MNKNLPEIYTHQTVAYSILMDTTLRGLKWTETFLYISKMDVLENQYVFEGV